MMILGSKRKKLILEQSTIEVPPIRGDDSDPTLTPAGTFSQMSGEAVYGIVRRYGIVGSIHSHNS
jgi:hypothetical protein